MGIAEGDAVGVLSYPRYPLPLAPSPLRIEGKQDRNGASSIYGKSYSYLKEIEIVWPEGVPLESSKSRLWKFVPS
jgi:hypothetical protein